MITDKLRSYGAAKRQVMPGVEHRSHKGLNNRAENSHVPLRKRERMMQGFRSPGGLQRFVAIFSAIRNHFVPPLTFGKCNPPSPPQGNGAVE
ncbi:DDE superfamily endonuclease [Phyllobacterium brassicacearum]|nr:DDE superfamily endonuclease [Phyllobacterium brassicacearum]